MCVHACIQLYIYGPIIEGYVYVQLYIYIIIYIYIIYIYIYPFFNNPVVLQSTRFVWEPS